MSQAVGSQQLHCQPVSQADRTAFCTLQCIMEHAQLSIPAHVNSFRQVMRRTAPLHCSVAPLRYVCVGVPFLQAAHVICKGTRAQLKMAAEEVQRQMNIITCTRKKQACLEVLEAATKIKKVKDLQQTLRCEQQPTDKHVSIKAGVLQSAADQLVCDDPVQESP